VSDFVSHGLFWLLSAIALAGAVAVVAVRDVMRMALGLGAFLLAVAGFFAYYGFGFLALAEMFVYVGGVLVLVLFAIMLVHRAGGGEPALENRNQALGLLAAGALSILVFAMLSPLVSVLGAENAGIAPGALAAELLGPQLPQFEVAGVLLLVSLVAVVAIVGGDRK
jgi:NADH-quinone oxidoreductase subunit J